MRTTIELPDELFRQVKARAALDGLKLKDLVASYIEQGLRRGVGHAAAPRQRSPLPLIAKASTGIPIPALSREEIARIEEEEDEARFDRLTRR